MWDSLEPTLDARVRYCGECKRTVHYCNTPDELYEAMLDDHCVALTLIRDDQVPERLMGDISPPSDWKS